MRLMKIAETAARAVRDPLLSAFRSEMAVDYKVDLHDIVTIHDKRAEAAIRAVILASEPNSAIMGEEGGQIGSGDVQWYVDPIDGTANFARGLAFWCVSIAAVIDGEAVAGVVYDPVADQMFSANLEASYLDGDKLRSRSVADETRATLITGYPHSRHLRPAGREAALANFGPLVATFSTLHQPGSPSLSTPHVAAGCTDAAPRVGVHGGIAELLLQLGQLRQERRDRLEHPRRDLSGRRCRSRSRRAATSASARGTRCSSPSP